MKSLSLSLPVNRIGDLITLKLFKVKVFSLFSFSTNFLFLHKILNWYCKMQMTATPQRITAFSSKFLLLFNNGVVWIVLIFASIQIWSSLKWFQDYFQCFDYFWSFTIYFSFSRINQNSYTYFLANLLIANNDQVRLSYIDQESLKPLKVMLFLYF